MKYDKLPQFAEVSRENYLQEVPSFMRLFFVISFQIRGTKINHYVKERLLFLFVKTFMKRNLQMYDYQQ